MWVPSGGGLDRLPPHAAPSPPLRRRVEPVTPRSPDSPNSSQSSWRQERSRQRPRTPTRAHTQLPTDRRRSEDATVAVPWRLDRYDDSPSSSQSSWRQKRTKEPVRLQPCSQTSGHALPKLMSALLAKLVIVSTPEFGPGPRDGEYNVPVMRGIEQLSRYVPNCFGCYDFKGSAAARDCADQVPDKDVDAHGWSDRVTIETTQWFRYWSGRVRSTFATVLLTAAPAAGEVLVYDRETWGHVVCPSGSRTTFAVSISGGPITGTEKVALPGLINGTIADLSMRDLDIGELTIQWLHFESLEDFLKALQGYGGIDFGGAMKQRQKFDLPGQWIDGDYQEKYDLLKGVPGATPQKRRAFLLAPAAPDQAALNQRLIKAIYSKSVPRVRELLGLDATNTPLLEGAREGARPAICADPNTKHPATGASMFLIAATKCDLEMMEALLAARADPCADNTYGFCPLQRAATNAPKALDACANAPGVRERVDAALELCAQRQLGKSYADHLASLAVGAAVTWTQTFPDGDANHGEFAGTVVAIDASDLSKTHTVRGAASGNLRRMNPGGLRVQSAGQRGRPAHFEDDEGGRRSQSCGPATRRPRGPPPRRRPRSPGPSAAAAAAWREASMEEALDSMAKQQAPANAGEGSGVSVAAWRVAAGGASAALVVTLVVALIGPWGCLMLMVFVSYPLLLGKALAPEAFTQYLDDIATWARGGSIAAATSLGDISAVRLGHR